MYDLLVIGGGINGTGIARDAAGRGLKVLLCEKDDLASHTSSSSTKLIHGGLRYLEHYDFALVRKALIEREVLLEAAPHIIWPMRFVLPHQKSLRPAWLIRLGLFLYDHLGGRKLLPPTKVLRRGQSKKFAPLRDKFKLAFEYSDCWVDDARLVVLNAVDARERGASVLTRTRCAALKREGGHWSATLKVEGEAEQTVNAKAVVNAAGPWVEDIIDQAFETKSGIGVRLVKGSHIITRKLFEGEHAYFFQNGDGRIMFAIPYENEQFTLVGTTDLPYDADKDEVKISQEEITYLCEAASEYFAQPVTPDDVVATYSGVRPLYDDQSDNASTVTRDYVLAYDNQDGKAAPIVSVFGGKITTYRKLAENTLSLFKDDLPTMDGPWTKSGSLPGGDLPSVDFDDYFAAQSKTYDWLPEEHLHRLLRAYGTRAKDILGAASSPNELGFHYGGGLYQSEVDYLVKYEFARSAEDILLRRTKTGLHLEPEQAAMLDAWFDRRDAA